MLYRRQSSIFQILLKRFFYKYNIGMWESSEGSNTYLIWCTINLSALFYYNIQIYIFEILYIILDIILDIQMSYFRK